MDQHSGRVVERVVDLTLRAQRGPLPPKAVLAGEYGCNWRTIHRLLAVIEQRVPVRFRDEVGA